MQDLTTGSLYGHLLKTTSYIILAPVLIFGWGTGRPLGVAGAAIATVIAIAVGTVWLALYFAPATSYLKFVRAEWTPRVSLWADMLKIGLPAAPGFPARCRLGVNRPASSTVQLGSTLR